MGCLVSAECRFCGLLRRELDKNASSWGYNTPADPPPHQGEGLLPSITSRKAGAGSTIQQAQQQLQKSRLYDNVPARVTQQQQEQGAEWNDTAAAQRAFRKEAQQRRLHQKQFHAKQSIRQRQQVYDQAVKARLAQGLESVPVAASGKKSSSGLSKSDLPQIVSGVSGSPTMIQGPRAKRLQAIARQPRPPELARPPRQISRMPDDVFLPDIAGSKGAQLGPAGSNVALLVKQSPRLSNIISTEEYDDCTVDVSASLLPQLSSQRSRRLTQEVPHLSSQSSMK